MSNAAQTASETSPAIALQVISAEEKSKLVFVDHDEFTIGADEHCDLSLPQAGLARLQSILYVQGQAIWIEAVHPEALIIVNDEVFRWRALRDGDQLTFGSVETLVHIGEASVQAAREQLRSRRETEDLALLSAEDLCDRIELEEHRVGEFERRRRLGWQAMLSAMQSVLERDDAASSDDAMAVPLVAGLPDVKFHELVAQVQNLSETLDERTKSLAAQEALLVESTSQICEVQRRVSRQLDQLLERISTDDQHPGELRVSA